MPSEPLDLPPDAEVMVNVVEVLLADVVLSGEDEVAAELSREHRMAVRSSGREAYGPVEWVVWPSDPRLPDPGRPDPDKRWFALRVQLVPPPEAEPFSCIECGDEFAAEGYAVCLGCLEANYSAPDAQPPTRPIEAP